MIGIIIGLLIGITILLTEIVLKSRGGTLIERIQTKTQQKGGIIEPDELSESIVKKIKKNESDGVDTHLEDL